MWVRLIAASATAALVLGVGARLTMRFIALEAGLPGAFSLGGSLEIVAFGALAGAPVALGFLLLRARLHGWGAWPGVLLGVALLVVAAAFPPPSARSAMAATTDTPAATAAAFGVLFVGWGLVLEWLHRRIGSSRARDHSSAGPAAPSDPTAHAAP